MLDHLQHSFTSRVTRLRLLGLHVALLLWLAPAVSGAQTIVLQDNFNDNSLDSSKWSTILPFAGPPKGPSSVLEQNMHIELQNRGWLVTQSQFNPVVLNGIQITGTFQFNQTMPFPSDGFDVVTRNDATTVGPFGFINDGIRFSMSSDPAGGLSIGGVGLAAAGTVPVSLVLGGLPTGQVLHFEVIDDGVNLSLKVSDQASNVLGAISTTTTTSSLPQNFVAFFNREKVFAQPFLTFLDNVVIVRLDTDGDGIRDNIDQCDMTDPVPPSTVTIDGCDSGVQDQLLSDPLGCTIEDQVEACAASDSNHGEFVSCVASLTNVLKKDKIITGQEKGAIQSCAAQANLP